MCIVFSIAFSISQITNVSSIFSIFLQILNVSCILIKISSVVHVVYTQNAHEKQNIILIIQLIWCNVETEHTKKHLSEVRRWQNHVFT